MANEFVKLASVGNVPSEGVVRSGGIELRLKKLAKVAMAAIRKVDSIAQDYFGAMAEARSRKPIVCECGLPRSY